MTELDLAAEQLAERMKTLPVDDPFMKHLEARTAEFLRSRGFDISTLAGCKGALAWLESAKVEEAFVDAGEIESSADWYIGEARLDGMKRIVENRLKMLPKKSLLLKNFE